MARFLQLHTSRANRTPPQRSPQVQVFQRILCKPCHAPGSTRVTLGELQFPAPWRRPSGPLIIPLFATCAEGRVGTRVRLAQREPTCPSTKPTKGWPSGLELPPAASSSTAASAAESCSPTRAENANGDSTPARCSPPWKPRNCCESWSALKH